MTNPTKHSEALAALESRLDPGLLPAWRKAVEAWEAGEFQLTEATPTRAVFRSPETGATVEFGVTGKEG